MIARETQRKESKGVAGRMRDNKETGDWGGTVEHRRVENRGSD